MDNKIILDSDTSPSENGQDNQKNANILRPNLFQGRTDSENSNGKFPDWDIIPPNQFINPRIKPQ